MIPVDIFKDKEIAVFGMGLSGVSASKALLAGGAQVAGYDDREDGRGAAVKYGIPYVDLNIADWRRFSALVLAPGVPLTHPKPHWTVEMARKAGAEIIGDTELFFRARAASGTSAKVIAITGTNGKSTTAALIHHCLMHAGREAQLGGNIGNPVLDLSPFAADKIYVLELSSYQLDLTPSVTADVAIHLNITPDHLDRHGSLEEYAAVKAKIFNGLSDNCCAVVGVDDGPSKKIADRINGTTNIWRLSSQATPQNGVNFQDGALEIWVDGEQKQRLSLEGIDTLRGVHNAQNAAAAFVAATHVGLTPAEILAGFKSFPGLAHRMEVLGRASNVLFVNDSKATNADAAAKALSSFKNIYWIAGGQAKQGGIETLTDYFPNISKTYLIGECATEFAATLEKNVPYELSKTVAEAVKAASQEAKSSTADEPVVLLSPAAASFDQFENFMLRGDAFREAVGAIDGFANLKT